MKDNETLQKDVQDAIHWETLLTATSIVAIAKDGVITLSGTVDGYTKKTEAEKVAQSIAGVTAVIENIK